MQNTESDRIEDTGGEEHSPSTPHEVKRRGDRRSEVSLFAYNGPERRSGRDRRDSQGR